MREVKKCLTCGEKLNGRSDKKFCDNQCRNTFNNQLRSGDEQFTRDINNILRKNRKILAELNATGKTKMHRDKLVTNGFNFAFFTNIYKTKEGKIYYFCYDQGYLPLENDFYFLVKREANYNKKQLHEKN